MNRMGQAGVRRERGGDIRIGSLHEVQRLDPDRGWVALRWSGRQPVWFRSRESALCDLCDQLRAGHAPRNAQGMPDLARYRITDGVRIWRPVWNAQRATVELRPVTATAVPDPVVGSDWAVPVPAASRLTSTAGNAAVPSR